jgi:hypothetical protein
MAKFILLYKGPATPQADITPEMGAQIMQAWEAWMGKVSASLVDVGVPFTGNSTAVVADGSTRSASDLTGYTIVEAADLDAAKALVGGHPFLDDGSSRFAVEIYELGTM